MWIRFYKNSVVERISIIFLVVKSIYFLAATRIAAQFRNASVIRSTFLSIKNVCLLQFASQNSLLIDRPIIIFLGLDKFDSIINSSWIEEEWIFFCYKLVLKKNFENIEKKILVYVFSTRNLFVKFFFIFYSLSDKNSIKR